MITHRNIYRYVYIYTLVYTHISLLCQLKGSTWDDIPLAWAHLTALISVFNAILQQERTGLLGEMTVSRTEAGNIQDEPEAAWHLLVPEISNCSKTNIQTHWYVLEGHRTQLKEHPIAKAGTTKAKQINKVVLDYDWKYKVGIHEPTLI